MGKSLGLGLGTWIGFAVGGCILRWKQLCNVYALGTEQLCTQHLSLHFLSWGFSAVAVFQMIFWQFYMTLYFCISCDSTWSCLKKDKQPQREESASTYTNPLSFMKISNLFKRTVYFPDGRVKHSEIGYSPDSFQIMVRASRVSRVRVSRVSVWG